MATAFSAVSAARVAAVSDSDLDIAAGHDRGDLISEELTDQFCLGTGDGVRVGCRSRVDPSRRNTATPPMRTHGCVFGNLPSASTARASTELRSPVTMVGRSPDTPHLLWQVP